jgi:DNA invertase Pin-like site-specific DNA recombinase
MSDMNAAAPSGLNFGYVRVSTNEQDEALQLDALHAAGIPDDRIYTDRGVSGTKTSRPELDALLRTLRPGDTVTVWRLDRLGRSSHHVVSLVLDLEDRGIGFKCLTGLEVDTTTPTGRFMLRVFAALAEMERDIIRERTVAGLDAARARGRRGGRRPKLSVQQVTAVTKLYAGREHTVAELAEMFGVSRSTIYNAVGTVDGNAATALDL